MNFDRELNNMIDQITCYHQKKQKEICEKHLTQIIDQFKWMGFDFNLFTNDLNLTYFIDNSILTICFGKNNEVKNIDIVFNYDFTGNELNPLNKNRIIIKNNNADEKNNNFNSFFNNFYNQLNKSHDEIGNGILYNIVMVFSIESLELLKKIENDITTIKRKVDKFKKEDALFRLI